jgi:hypothetical protein
MTDEDLLNRVSAHPAPWTHLQAQYQRERGVAGMEHWVVVVMSRGWAAIDPHAGYYFSPAAGMSENQDLNGEEATSTSSWSRSYMDPAADD